MDNKKINELYLIIYEYQKIIKQLENKLYYEQKIKEKIISRL